MAAESIVRMGGGGIAGRAGGVRERETGAGVGAGAGAGGGGVGAAGDSVGGAAVALPVEAAGRTAGEERALLAGRAVAEGAGVATDLADAGGNDVVAAAGDAAAGGDAAAPDAGWRRTGGDGISASEAAGLPWLLPWLLLWLLQSLEVRRWAATDELVAATTAGGFGAGEAAGTEWPARSEAAVSAPGPAAAATCSWGGGTAAPSTKNAGDA